MEATCDACHITLNKNSVHGDKSAFSPGGVRIGTPALTSRGFNTQVCLCFILFKDLLSKCL